MSTRTELISSWQYGPPFVAADVPPPPPGEGEKPVTDPDDEVSAALAKIEAGLNEATAAQAKDLDKDPDDEKVAAGLAQLAKDLAALKEVQGADDDADAPDKPPARVGNMATGVNSTTGWSYSGIVQQAPSLALLPNAPKGGTDMDPRAECQTPDCGHLASAHGDGTEGRNTGACTMQGCACTAFAAKADNALPTGGDSGTEGPAQGGPDATSSASHVALAEATPPAASPPAAPPAESSTTKPPEVEGSTVMGPAFTIPCLIIEGEDTGDGRAIAPGALDWRVPPLPLMGLKTATHDPMGMDMNAPATIVGRIDSITREGSTISAKGYFDDSEDGMEYAALVESMGRFGISADVAAAATELEVGDIDDMGWPTDVTETLTKGTIMGATMCVHPAFEGCYIVLGDGSAPPEEIPQEAEPVAASGVHWMTYEECGECGEGSDVLVAAGGPAAPPSAWFADPGFTEGDDRLLEILDSRGERTFGGKFACPLAVTPEGRVYGHVAAWGICHTGINGKCITAPSSKSGYAHFLRGQHVITAEGERVRTGVITIDAPHASTRPGVSAAAAMAHYDDTATEVAVVTCGEDEYGIWVAGAILPDVSDALVNKLRMNSLSGDWRNIGGSMEMIAALAVPVPGFPLAVVAAGRMEALVASGASVMWRLAHPVKHEEQPVSSIPPWALGPLLHLAKTAHRGRLERLRA